MSISKRFFAAFVAVTLTACGGGEPETSSIQTASSVTAVAAETVPRYRAELQSFEATNPTAITSQYLSRVASVDAAAALAPAAVGAPNDRAMWSWIEADISTKAKQNTMLNFAVGRGVNVIFLHAEGLLNKPALLSGFLNRAAAKSIKVELLFGAPDWSLTANHGIPVGLLKRVNTFVAGLTGARPVGVHFDIEPHGLPTWNSNQISLANQLLALYGKLMAAKAPGLYINADIAMGYEYVSLTRNGVTRTLSQWMVDATDRTTLMDYRDYSSGEDSIISHALHPVSYALSRGKRTVVGVETTCNLQPTKITFCEEGNKRMEANLATVKSYFQTNGGYGGTAIHDYASYRKLAP